MGIIRGFYEVRSYANTNYKLHYPRSGNALYMRTNANDTNNYNAWMMWQVSDTDTNYIELFSCVDCYFMSIMVVGEPTITKLYDGLKMAVDTSTSPTWAKIATETGGSIPRCDCVSVQEASTAVSSSSLGQFKMTKKTTTTINGTTCDVVSFQHSNTSKYLDATKAIASQDEWVTLESATGKNEQYFVLVPCAYLDSEVTAPTNIYLQAIKGDTSNALRTQWQDQTTYYPMWTDSANTINNGYKTAYRTRDATMDNAGKWTYSDWSATSTYATTDITTKGYQRWGASVTISECSTSIKEVAKYIALYTYRTLTAFGKTLNFQSSTITQASYFTKKPTLTKDGLSWTPDGMKVNFTSDYFGQGSLKLLFSSIKSGNTEILSKSYETSIVQDTTVTIPTSYLKRPPNDGEELTLKIRLNTDVYAPNNYYVSLTDTLTYDEGTVDVTPTITERDGLKYDAEVPYASTVKMWMSVNGKNTELTGTVYNGHTIFEILPPFQTDYALFTSYENSDKTVWGTAYTEMPQINIRAHAFTWSEGSVVIWLNKDEALKEEFSFSPQTTTNTFVGRSHDVVTYLSNGEKNYTTVSGTIKGFIVPTLETYGTTKESIEKMVEHGHVVYRAPYGRVCNVAVTDASISTDKGITEVSVSIVQEDV